MRIKANDIWQELMNDAYDRWQDKNDDEILNYEDMITKTSRLSQIAVLLGNLNYQIGNGGFEQWVDNGYAQNGEEVLKALREVGSPLSKKVSKWVETVLDYVNLDERNTGAGGNYWIDEGYEYEEECWEEEHYDEDSDEVWYEEECSENEVWVESGGRAVADPLDSRFYAINDEFMEEVSDWFIDEIAKEQ